LGILFIVGAVNCTHLNFINRCGYRVEVIRTENGRAPAHQAGLNPGDQAGADFGSNGMNFKNGWNGKTLAEFSFNSWNGMDFYDLSVIVGYDTPMRISTDRPGPTVTCHGAGCPDAYLFPTDDTKTHGVSTGGTFTVTFCP
ncbi:hypothetical protein PFISCL1PPCAC_26038, partial [Pristionchus fissidentatus]